MNKEYIKNYNILPILEQHLLQLMSLLDNIGQYSFLRECSLSIVPILNKIYNVNLTDKMILELLKKYKKMRLCSGNYNDHSVLPEVAFYLHQQLLSPTNPNLKDNMEFVNKRISHFHNSIYKEQDEILHFINLSIHLNDVKLLESLLNLSDLSNIVSNSVLAHLELDLDWINSKDIKIQAFICAVKLAKYNNIQKPAIYSLDEFKEYIDLYEKNDGFKKISVPAFIKIIFVRIDILTGNINTISEYSDSIKNPDVNIFCLLQKTILAFTQTDFKNAIKLFDKTWTTYEQLNHGNHRLDLITFPEIALLYAISFLATKNYKRYNSAVIKPLERRAEFDLTFLHKVLMLVYDCDFETAKINLKNYDYNNLSIIQRTLYHWVNYIVNNTNDLAALKQLFAFSLSINNKFAAHLLVELICIELQQDDYQSFLEKSPFGVFRLSKILESKPIWEHAIEKLENCIVNDVKKTRKQSVSRLLWILNQGRITLHEQSMLKNGSWSVVKDIGVTRFQTILENKHIFSETDIQALNMVSHEQYYGMVINSNVLLKLIGASNVFLQGNPPTRIDLIEGLVQLNITKDKVGYKLKLNYHYSETGIMLVKESNTRYLVVNYTENTVNIAQIIGADGMVIPAASKERVLNLIYNANSNIKIQADFEDENIASIPANHNRYIQLVPQNDGLHVSLLFQPFSPHELGYFYPAIGQSNLVYTSESAVRQKMARNFKLETKLAKELINNCVSLSNAQDYTWTFDDLESSLQVLDELSVSKNKFADLEIQWPKGQTLSVRKKIDHDNLSLTIKGSQNYFEYEGNITFDDGKVISMKSLLSLLEQSPQNKFIKLDDGSFITLSDNFRAQLAELNQVSHGNKIFNLTSGSLQNIVDETSDVKLDKSWREHIKRLNNISKHTPVVPSTLQTQLRDYQLDGFKYLSKLANWQIGACLADDMGLGKTVQTIALILERASNGATLIVAPTSVCFNWIQELEKFATTLNIYTAYDMKNRDTQIAELNAMDVLICSYGLLTSLEDVLIDKDWNVLVLDEAQAIKNYTTKRWEVVSKLKSSVRIALTGTPVENHLGELWSIMHFLNPGLLGTLKNFQSKFITPISNSNSDANQVAKIALKNIVKPYILRRTKTQVLTELPPKIEQSILIELSDEEMTFYEAIRQRSLEKLSNLDEHSKRISILAELTKLRQACCHSTLIEPTIDLPNSKLVAFIELMNEMKENNHKALIFSQYVRYLQIVKAELEKNGFTYEYIDGSTTVANREKAVNQFQSGSNDCFLISLKAGGTGLNLTAADYVVILDPWWNPAVEDQAAGRAHRMGQSRPVTVYRLITKNTIEENIIKLHQDKRNLAGDLLEGQDIGGKLTDDDLLALIR